jgi:hypothetical protein
MDRFRLASDLLPEDNGSSTLGSAVSDTAAGHEMVWRGLGCPALPCPPSPSRS